MIPVFINRLQAYKNQGKNAEASKQRRTDSTASLRKHRKEQDMNKRRSIEPEQFQCQMNHLVWALQNSSSQTMGSILLATEGLARILSRGPDRGSLDFIMTAGVIPIMTEFLDYDDLPDLQKAAVSLLGCLLSGNVLEETLSVVEPRILRCLSRLLKSSHLDVLEESVIALSSLAQDNCPVIMRILDLRILDQLLGLLDLHASAALDVTSNHHREEESLVRSTLCTLMSMCCSCCLSLTSRTVRLFLSALEPFLQSQDSKTVSLACDILCRLKKGSRHVTEDIPESLLAQMVRLMDTEDFSPLPSVLRFLSRVIFRSDHTTVRSKVLPKLAGLLKHPRPDIVQECLCIVGNLCTRGWQEVKSVIDAGIITPLVLVLSNGGVESRRLASWAANNLCMSCNKHQVSTLLEAGLHVALSYQLTLKDEETIRSLLQSLHRLLTVSRQDSQIKEIKLTIKETCGMSGLKKLSRSKRKDIKESAIELMSAVDKQSTI